MTLNEFNAFKVLINSINVTPSSPEELLEELNSVYYLRKLLSKHLKSVGNIVEIGAPPSIQKEVPKSTIFELFSELVELGSKLDYLKLYKK
jgi:hypothetical protein